MGNVGDTVQASRSEVPACTLYRQIGFKSGDLHREHFSVIYNEIYGLCTPSFSLHLKLTNSKLTCITVHFLHK